MIPINSKIGQGMRIHSDKLVNWNRKNELIPDYLENNTFKFYLNREVKSTETNNVNDVDHIILRSTVSSPETEMAEQCVRKSNDNSESRCSTNW